MQQEALHAISKIRYGKNGYFWINDMDHNMVMHPIKTDLTGKNFKNDPKVPFVTLAVNALKDNPDKQAIIDYAFYNPTTGSTDYKMSNVQLFEPWNWVIGTGTYVNDIKQEVTEMESGTQNKVFESIIKNIVISVVIIIVVVLGVALVVRQRIVNPIEKMTQSMTTIAQNKDLSTRLDTNLPKELCQIAECFNQLIEVIQAAMKESKMTAVNTCESTQELSQVAVQVGKRTESSVQVIKETRGEVNDVGAKIAQAVQEAKDNKEKIIEANQLLVKSKNDLVNLGMKIESNASSEKTISNKIQTLAEDTAQIKNVLGVIADIAEQTNLLALNAAIEAARAGEHGRGFSVVADEVRGLAERTQQSLVDVQDTVNAIVQAIGEASQYMIENAQEINELVSVSEGVQKEMGAIADTVKEVTELSDNVNEFELIAQTLKHISQSFDEIDQLSVENAKSVEVSTKNIQDLKQVTERLMQKLQQFRT